MFQRIQKKEVYVLKAVTVLVVLACMVVGLLMISTEPAEATFDPVQIWAAFRADIIVEISDPIARAELLLAVDPMEYFDAELDDDSYNEATFAWDAVLADHFGDEAITSEEFDAVFTAFTSATEAIAIGRSCCHRWYHYQDKERMPDETDRKCMEPGKWDKDKYPNANRCEDSNPRRVCKHLFGECKKCNAYKEYCN
jgi:hypothetical protein